MVYLVVRFVILVVAALKLVPQHGHARNESTLAIAKPSFGLLLAVAVRGRFF